MLNFLLQLAVDGASVFFIDRIGYRASALLAHGFAALGLIFLAVLPSVLPSAFAGLLISVLFYIVQAVVNNFVPLLFLTFQKQFGIPLSQVTLLITLLAAACWRSLSAPLWRPAHPSIKPRP